MTLDDQALGVAQRAAQRLRVGIGVVFALIVIAAVALSWGENAAGGLSSLLTVLGAFGVVALVVVVVFWLRQRLLIAVEKRAGRSATQLIALAALIVPLAIAAMLSAPLWSRDPSALAGVAIAFAFALALDYVSIAALPALIASGHPSADDVLQQLSTDADHATTLAGRWRVLLADAAGSMVTGAFLAYAAWSSPLAGLCAVVVMVAAAAGGYKIGALGGTKNGLILMWLTVAAVAAIALLV